MQQTITEYIDKSLDFITRHKAYLMYEEEPVPATMAVPFDAGLLAGKSQKLIIDHPEADGALIELMNSKGYLWQAVESTVTDADIAAIEQLGKNFIDFLYNTLKQGEGTVRELKDWEKRIHQ